MIDLRDFRTILNRDKIKIMTKRQQTLILRLVACWLVDFVFIVPPPPTHTQTPTEKGRDYYLSAFRGQAKPRGQNFALCLPLCNRKSPLGKDPNVKTLVILPALLEQSKHNCPAL